MSISSDFKTMFDFVIQEMEIDFSDYEYRRNLRENYEKRSRKWGFIMLELKQHFIKNPKLTGNVYEYRYIHHLHDKHIIEKEWRAKWKDPYVLIQLTRIYNMFKKNEEDKKIMLTPDDSQKEYSNLKKIYDMDDVDVDKTYFSNYNKENGITIKIRQRIKTLDYKASIIFDYSAINLKRWNKITKKTTNKGCVAVSAWSWTDRKGWTLDGFTAPDLKWFVKQNGFKEEKGKKYQYGDYAEWLLHTLV
jgi:hypothetical protein